jgi:hypothetical protein
VCGHSAGNHGLGPTEPPHHLARCGSCSCRRYDVAAATRAHAATLGEVADLSAALELCATCGLPRAGHDRRHPFAEPRPPGPLLKVRELADQLERDGGAVRKLIEHVSRAQGRPFDAVLLACEGLAAHSEGADQLRAAVDALAGGGS